MCGCVSRARIVPSRLKRSSAAGPTSAAFSSLTRGAALEAAVAALREPDAAHAAVADRRDERVGADGHAGQRRARAAASPPASRKPSACQRAVLGEQRLHVGCELGVLEARSAASQASARSAAGPGVVEMRAGALPAVDV